MTQLWVTQIGYRSITLIKACDWLRTGPAVSAPFGLSSLSQCAISLIYVTDQLLQGRGSGGVTHNRVAFCVNGRVSSDVSMDNGASMFREKKRKFCWSTWLWRRRGHGPPKRLNPLTHWHSVTSQKTWNSGWRICWTDWVEIMATASSELCGLYHRSPIWITVHHVYLLCTSCRIAMLEATILSSDILYSLLTHCYFAIPPSILAKRTWYIYIFHILAFIIK